MNSGGTPFDPTKPQFSTHGGSGAEILNGVLNVTGTGFVDDIRIFEVANNLLRVKATFNGNSFDEFFDQNEVNSIRVHALDGDDTVINATSFASTVFGGGGGDFIAGGSANDSIFAQGGEDEVRGNEGDDIINLGEGNDIGLGGDGDDIVIGANGNDSLQGGAHADVLLGGFGNDVLLGGTHDDVLAGGFGNDNMNGQGGFNALNGQSGDDTLRGFFHRDAVNGGGQANDIVMTTFLVDSTSDIENKDFSTGDLSLREAISLADDHDIIRFDPLLAGGDSTITLTNGQLDLNFSIRIVGGQNNDLTINGNAASRIFSVNAGTDVRLTRLHLTNGSADDGAAINVLGKVNIIDSILHHNTANDDGGAVNVTTSGTAIVRQSTMHDNTAATASGGAILNAGTLHVSDSTFFGNDASGTGGAISQSASSAEMTVINSTVSGNTSQFQGGIGIFSGNYTINNSTIAFNMSRGRGFGGGGISVRSTAVGAINNTLVIGNTVFDGTEMNDLNESVDNSQWHNNLIGVPYLSDLAEGFNGHLVGDAVTATLDPNLEFNGGTTRNHALVAGSRAFNGGRNDMALDRLGNPLTKDQRGANRINGLTVDIGSYEA